MFMISLRNLKQSVIAFIDIALNRDVRKICHLHSWRVASFQISISRLFETA